MLTELKSARRMVGLKQSRKAVRDGVVKAAFIAGDADKKITVPFTELCRQHDVSHDIIPTMQELGKACGINVGTAVAVVLKD